LDFKNHAIAGLATGSAVAGTSYYFSKNIEISFMMGAVTLAGSLIPDLDTGSIPSRIFAWIGIVLSLYLMYINQSKFAAIIGVAYMAFSAPKHRGLTHKWVLPIACLIGAYISKQVWPGAFAAGLVTHFALDKIPPWKII
jgi:hypothetical protein